MPLIRQGNSQSVASHSLNASVNSTRAIPPGQPRGICSGPGGGAFVHPEGDQPGISYTRFQNRQKPGPSREMFYSFAMEAFVGKDIDFTSQ